MKSYFLERISSLEAARAALRARLPGQEAPWLLLSSAGDPVAYFEVHGDLDGEPVPNVQANVSGRHFDQDALVINVLKDIQGSIGGRITNDA